MDYENFEHQESYTLLEIEPRKQSVYIDDSTPVFPLIQKIGNELHLDVSDCCNIMAEGWADTVGSVRTALEESWVEWKIPTPVEAKLREMISFGSSGTYCIHLLTQGLGNQVKLRERFILTLQNALEEKPGVSLQDLLLKALDLGRLIIDEMQYLYQFCPEMVTSIIQFVDSITAKHTLFLCGTPRIGVYPVLFEEHTLGRLTPHLVPNFNALEIYAILKRICDIDFSVYLKLWSCFGGIPGLYNMAHNKNCFTRNSVDMLKIQNLLQQYVLLTPQERAWVEKASKIQGDNIPENEKDAVYRRLLSLDVIVVDKSVTYLKDKVLRALKTLDTSSDPLEARTRMVCGYGLENMAESIADDLCSYLTIENSEEFETSYIGYGESDVDLVMLRKKQHVSEAVCFSCKLNGTKHTVDFFKNIEMHLEVAKPSKIYLVLCTAEECNLYKVLNMFPSSHLFSWGYITISTRWLDMRDAIKVLHLQKAFKFEPDSTWPMLIRTSVQTALVDHKSKILHLLGQRRVGKTHLLKKMLTKNDIYIDTKLLNL